MTVYPIQATFTKGELDPVLHGRVDLDLYRQGLMSSVNWVIMRQGGIQRRPGTNYMGPARYSLKKSVVRPFEFNEDQSYTLEFGDLYCRFWGPAGRVEGAANVITGITKASTCTVTSAAHTFVTGDPVHLSVTGMYQMNGVEALVGATTANTFVLVGVDSTEWSTFVSGNAYKIIEITTTYVEADLPYIQVTQSGDVVYVACDGYAPRKITRASETSWSIADISFKDGPFLNLNGTTTYLTLASRGSIMPTAKMTSNILPAGGTVADSAGDADAWRAFNHDGSDQPGIGTTTGWYSYTFTAGTKVCDHYYLQSNINSAAGDMFVSWTLDGYDGANWVTLDTRTNESGWGANETRFYEFDNVVSFAAYRINYWGGGGSDATGGALVEAGFNQAGDDQTPFNCTASATTGINGGSGFAATDVGRTIQIIGSDGKYRWLRIVAFTSTTVVTVRMYGHCLPNAASLRIVQWAMSAWNVMDGYPRAVGFIKDRLAWGGSSTSPRTVWTSKTADYENMGRSAPLVADDGMKETLSGGRLDRITWIEEVGALIIGTAGDVRTLGQADNNTAFSATNVKSDKETLVKSSWVRPVGIEKTLIFADRYRTRIHEGGYDLNSNGILTPELSILNAHIYQRAVKAMAFQANPSSIIWGAMDDGSMSAFTYEKNQQVAGGTTIYISGGAGDTNTRAFVEDCCVTSSPTGDQLWMVVRRTIRGVPVRYIEVMAAPFVANNDESSVMYAVLADSSLLYEGADASLIYGFNHMIGETLGVLCDGVDVGDAVVASDGGLTVPGGLSGSVIIAGLRAPSTAQTLRMPAAGNQDGSALGRSKRIVDVVADLFATAELYVSTPNCEPELLEARTMDDLPQTEEQLITGTTRSFPDDSWRNGGTAILYSESMYPACIRALLLGTEGEP